MSGDADWLDPDWKAGGKVHNWRSYVPDDVRAIWPTFTPAQRLALFNWADALADQEEWD